MAKYQNVDRGPAAPVKPWSEKSIEKSEVAAAGPALLGMQEDISRIRTLLGGTLAMREAGRTYLPQHTYEPNGAYDKRLAVTYLDNYTLRTLDTLVGKAFKEPPEPGEEMPDSIVELLDDVDDEGTGFIPFARQWFRKGVEQALAYVIVDMPMPSAKEDGSARTMEDDRREGLRPIWRLIPAEDMLDFQIGKVTDNGIRRTAPTVVRFRDDEVRQVTEFTSEIVQRVKVLRHEGSLVTWEAWELKKGPRGGKPKWVQVQPPTQYGLGCIPLVTFYTDKTGTGEGKTKLAALADLNIRHWQSTADQINILTVSRFPILAASGIRDTDGQGDGGEIVIGPNKFITTPDPQSKVYYVEHTGSAVQTGVIELERLEKAMASYGAQFMQKGAQGPETASGRVLDEAEAISPLQSWGIDFKDCLELACYYTAQWLKLGEVKTSISFEIEGEVDLANPTEVQSLDAARERKDISREAWIEEARMRGILKNENYDPEADAERIADEAPPPGTGLDGMAAGLTGVKGGNKLQLK